MWASRAKKFAITSSPSRCRSSATRFPRAGQWRPLISLTRWFRGSQPIGSGLMDLVRSKIIPGLKIFPGPTFGTANFKHHLFLPKRTTLIKKTSMKIGKTRKMKNSSRTSWASEETQSNPNSTATTLTSSLPHWVKTQPSSIQISSSRRPLTLRRPRLSPCHPSVYSSHSRKRYRPRTQRNYLR